MTEPNARGQDGRPSIPPAVRLVAAVAAVLFWLALFTLTSVAGLPVLDGVLLSALLVAVPGLSLAQLPLIDDAPIERTQAYWGSILALWLLGSASWFVGTRSGGGGAAVGFVAIDWAPFVLWAAGLTAGALVTILLFRQLSMWTGKLDSRFLRQLLPRTREERSIFGVLSVAAGVGEEIAYRGYAITALAPVLGVPGAAIVTSIVFGLLHGYQGALGILRTGAMGGMLAWGFVATGSLWPAIVAHTAIDLLAGLWLGERLLFPRSV